MEHAPHGGRKERICIRDNVAAGLRLPAETAEVSGLVFDPSKAVVPSAQMVVENTDTSATRSGLSNQGGMYNVTVLPPGRYSITVQADAFQTIHETNVFLEVDQHARLDFSLEVGRRHQSIVVEGSAPLLDSSDASLSTLIGNRLVENLPLNGRSFSSLTDLAPGVVLVRARLRAGPI